MLPFSALTDVLYVASGAYGCDYYNMVLPTVEASRLFLEIPGRKEGGGGGFAARAFARWYRDRYHRARDVGDAHMHPYKVHKIREASPATVGTATCDKANSFDRVWMHLDVCNERVCIVDTPRCALLALEVRYEQSGHQGSTACGNLACACDTSKGICSAYMCMSVCLVGI